MNESPRCYLTVPNALSAVRILLVVPLLYFFRAEMFLPTLALFLISAIGLPIFIFFIISELLHLV